jgi:cytochrome c biogenesis protein CcmG/thiol:disulfide interchange protein DsbE
MTLRQQWLAVGGVVAVLALALVIATRFVGDEFYDVRVGTEAPGFNAVDLTPGHTADVPFRSLSDYRGRVVLLNIWATWCEPCKREMPSMQQLHQDYAERGLAVVAVSVDAEDKADAIRAFVQDYALTFDILHDRTGLFRSVYRYTGVPETYIVDRDGVIRRKWIGEDDWNSPANRKFIERLLSSGGASDGAS